MGMAPQPERLETHVPRCPSCGVSDVVPTLQKKWFDWLFRQGQKDPWVCRFCGRRFYVKQRESSPQAETRS
jgi:transcription elongation factor Elf1